MARRGRTAGLVVAAIALTAAAAGACLEPLPVDAAGFKCETDADCQGLSCVQGLCRDCSDGTCEPAARCAAALVACPPQALACDGFDAAPDGGSDFPGWTTLLETFSGAPPASGQVAVLDRVDGHDCNDGSVVRIVATGELRAALMRTVPGQRTLHTRAMYFLPAGSNLQANLGLLTNNGGADAVYAGVSPTQERFYVNPVRSGLGFPYLLSEVSFPRGRWFCLELGVTHDATPAAGRVQLWMDDQPLIDAPVATTGDPQTLGSLVRFGAAISSAQTEPIHIFMDSAVVSPQRIGCPDAG